MSTPLRPSRRVPRLPTPAEGTEVAAYRSYAEAQAGVDLLSEQDFPVEAVAIVGKDLQLVERITGRLSWGRVLLGGLVSGAWFGLFIAVFMTAFNDSPLPASYLLAGGVALGCTFGLLFSAITYMLAGNKRDFTSSSQVVAARYAILTTRQSERARELLASTTGNLGRQEPLQPEPTGPTRFGSRLDEEPAFGVRLPKPPSAATPETTTEPADRS